jgi:4-hydroxybenzoate polyprenyltransferase
LSDPVRLAPASSLGTDLWRAMRPHQWVKNGFVLAPLAFAGPSLRSGGTLTAALVSQVLAAVLCFCLASSATYLLNDISDVEADRRHPVKRQRPIASGALQIGTAWRAFAVLLLVALSGAWLVRPSVAAIVGTYFCVNVLYSKGLKRIAYVDAVVIALGFLLRLLAGGEAAQVHLSRWLIGCTVLLALYLALGKRKHELLTSDDGHRSSLRHYRVEHLNFALGVLAAATAGAYLAYTLDRDTAARFHTDRLPWTTPFAVFGLLRFYQLVEDNTTAASPTDRMLRDRVFAVNLAAWACTVGVLIYGGVWG